MVKTSPNTRPIVLWVSQEAPGTVGNLWPLDGAARHIPGGACPCRPTLRAETSDPVWVHRTELMRLVIPTHVPDTI